MQVPSFPAGPESGDPSSPDRKIFRFSLHSLPRPQKRWGLETGNRPEKTKPVHTSGFLQDGITPNDHIGRSIRRLDDIHRTQGHILTYSVSSSFSEISGICSWTTAPSVPEPSFWALHLPESVFKGTNLDTCSPKKKRSQSLPLFRQHSSISKEPKSAVVPQENSPINPFGLQMVNEQQKEPAYAYSGDGLSLCLF